MGQICECLPSRVYRPVALIIVLHLHTDTAVSAYEVVDLYAAVSLIWEVKAKVKSTVGPVHVLLRQPNCVLR